MSSKFPYIETETLINAVKKRPDLYRKEFNSQHIMGLNKRNLWYEVCQETLADWDKWDAIEKEDRYIEILQRWKNLRTGFGRELRLQEKPHRTAKSREYKYFKQMSFLKGCIGRRTQYPAEPKIPENDRDTSDPLNENFKIENDEEGFVECSKNDEGGYNYCDVELTSVNKNGEVKEQTAIDKDFPEERIMKIFEKSKKEEKGCRIKVPEKSHTVQLLSPETPEVRIMSMLTECRRIEDNPDRQFLLSLVPTFQKLSDAQKVDVRIQILEVLKKITYQDD